MMHDFYGYSEIQKYNVTFNIIMLKSHILLGKERKSFLCDKHST